MTSLLFGLNLETVIELLLLALIGFCGWQQFQLGKQRATIARLEAQVDILITLQDPLQKPSPNEAGALWQKLVALRRPADPSKKPTL
jgi:hypothetical protein